MDTSANRQEYCYGHAEDAVRKRGEAIQICPQCGGELRPVPLPAVGPDAVAATREEGLAGTRVSRCIVCGRDQRVPARRYTDAYPPSRDS